MSMDQIIRKEARLIILRFLAEQVNRSLTSTALTLQANEMFLLNKPREWFEQEMAYLADMGAVTVTGAGSVKIATLTAHGARHLTWGVLIPDVLRPTEPMRIADGA